MSFLYSMEIETVNSVLEESLETVYQPLMATKYEPLCVSPAYEPLELETTFRQSSLSSPYEEYIRVAPNYENSGRRLSLPCAYE